MSSAAAPDPASPSASAKASARVADLFERHGRMVYGICRAMLRDVQEAEDATQQAFLSAHRALLGGAHVRDAGAWIASIARNECRARISAAMRAPLPAADEDLAEIPDRVDAAERRLQAGELRDALAELPDRQREAVILRYVYGLRYREVARALGLSVPATEALLFRARRAMRVRLRHATAAALVVPLSVREELALALPGFESHAGSGAAAAGVAGGVLAKLVSAPAAAKLATATVAVSAVGAVGVAESNRPMPDARAEARPVAEPRDEKIGAPSPDVANARLERDEDSSGDDHRGGGEGRSGRNDSDDDEGRVPGGGTSGGDDDRPRVTSGRGGSGSGSRDDEPAVEHERSSGPGSERSEGGEDDAGSHSPDNSGPSDSGSDDAAHSDEPDDHSGSGSSGSGEDSSGSGSDDELGDVDR